MKRLLHRRTQRQLVATLLVFCGLLAPWTVAFESTPKGAASVRFSPNLAVAQGRTISLNQKRARIEQLVRKIGEAAEETILVPDDVRGTISIVAKRPVTIGEAWQVLESALSILGFSLLPSTEGTWRIAKVATAVGEAPFDPDARGTSDSFVTTLIPLEVAQIDAVLPILEPLSGSRVTLVPYAETNTLIASGSERAIARLTEIADELDRVEERALRIRVLRHRGVGETEALVEGFLERAPRHIALTEVWSDERSNSLVLRGSPEGINAIVDFIERIDRPDETRGAIRILRVLHRDPEEIAELIRSLSDGMNAVTSELAEAATPLDGADYSIGVDGPTRSLVVRADPQTHQAIQDLVERVDAPPQLVAVDLTISELRTPEVFGSLIGFSVPFEAGEVLGIVTNSPSAGDVPPTVAGRIQRDTNVSFIPPGSTTPVSIPIEVSLAATDFDGTNEVLIQPSLIVIAGEEHEIFVGDNLPIPVTDNGGLTGGEDGGATVGGVSLSTLSRTTRFERTDVGTRLTVEVRAGQDGRIRLELDIELSALDLTRAGLAGDPFQVGPSFTQKNLTIQATLEDGESAILAVDRRKSVTNIESGIPFLRDIPFLGFLFGAKGRQVDDVRLMVVARARRVSNPSELVADTVRRRLAFERRSRRSSGLPPVEGPPFAVRVTTRRRLDDADSIAESLSLRGHVTRVHTWEGEDEAYHDVYVIGLASMADAAGLAKIFGDEGWSADLVVFPQRH